MRKDLTSHGLRGMYATYMFNTENLDNQNINGYISKVLNHEGPDSSLNYSNYIYANGFTKNESEAEDVVDNGNDDEDVVENVVKDEQ